MDLQHSGALFDLALWVIIAVIVWAIYQDEADARRRRKP